MCKWLFGNLSEVATVETNVFAQTKGGFKFGFASPDGLAIAGVANIAADTDELWRFHDDR